MIILTSFYGTTTTLKASRSNPLMMTSIVTWRLLLDTKSGSLVPGKNILLRIQDFSRLCGLKIFQTAAQRFTMALEVTRHAQARTDMERLFVFIVRSLDFRTRQSRQNTLTESLSLKR